MLVLWSHLTYKTTLLVFDDFSALADMLLGLMLMLSLWKLHLLMQRSLRYWLISI